MSNQYINRVVAILGPLWRNNRLESVTWTTPAEAKQVVLILRQKKAEIKLVKQDITAHKQQVHAQFANKKAHVGKSAGAGLATGLFGAKIVGKANVLNRNALRQQELQALQPYVDAERFIAQITAGLDQIKGQIDIWLTTHK